MIPACPNGARSGFGGAGFQPGGATPTKRRIRAVEVLAPQSKLLSRWSVPAQHSAIAVDPQTVLRVFFLDLAESRETAAARPLAAYVRQLVILAEGMAGLVFGLPVPGRFPGGIVIQPWFSAAVLV